MSEPLFTLIPGWRLGRGPLQPLAQALHAQWYDLPGYGSTPFTTDFTQAAAHLGAHCPAGTILVGWSLGAMLALAAAAAHPERIAAVVAIAGTPSFVQRGPGWPHGMSESALAEFRAAVAEDEAAMLPRFVAGFNRGDNAAKTITAQILTSADPAPPLPVLLAGLDWLAEIDLRFPLLRLSVPVLAIHGENDPLIPIAAGEVIATAAPAGELMVVPDAAHAPFLSRPKAVTEAVIDFAIRCGRSF